MSRKQNTSDLSKYLGDRLFGFFRVVSVVSVKFRYLKSYSQRHVTFVSDLG